MYNPAQFEQRDRAALAGLMREHPLATLVIAGDDGLDANHIPLLYDATDGEHGTLRGHVARANPLWQALASGRPALAIFHGPQAYVSPSWYPSKQEHGKVVPTWNYAVVHAHGIARAIDDAGWLRQLLVRLTDAHEQHRPSPWGLHDAPIDFTDQLLRAIVGIELPVSRLIGKWKVSQNRATADREGVIAGLQADGQTASAALVLGGDTTQAC